jgi:exodeoxyribonuclease-1
MTRFQSLWQAQSFSERSDPDQLLYDGFVSDGDRSLCDRAIAEDPAALGSQSFPFADQRLPEMLFRYRARNFPHTLSDVEAAQWREHCQLQRQEGSFTLMQFEAELVEERARPEVTEKTLTALNQVEEWVRALSVQG